MKINSQNPLARPTSTAPREETQPAKGPERTQQSDAGPAAQTHLRQAAIDTSHDIDTARVEEIREAIREGRLEIRADRIADALIDSLQQTTGNEGDA
ncbi:flagellar biosynthesis anti-sigma factor FlgM [Halomonas sp. NO4]|uniref:flagellar biosynthesis anti-sigma factor FlgM n=1 Tax=Halomonas sp. NO4 TaxID=2484813 RepID=UPI0013D180A0|nr:flagellar biosynthesis anti-sigma factor FlgM [Halomonas sp. NO4]